MATTGKIAEVLFENALETHEKQIQLLDLTNHYEPDSSAMQNAGNYVWRPVQQHAPIIDGFDLTGLETDIIEETYPAILGTPKNDFIEQRVDDLRDIGFWERRGVESGKRQASELNKSIAELIKDTGSLYYEITASGASGYDAIATGQAIMNERQLMSEDMRYVCLNDRDNLIFGNDLAGRQTLQGRPADTWATGQIGRNVAGFDIYTGSFMPTLTGGAITDTTTTAAISEAPEAGSVNATTGVVTNVDYRTSGNIPVVSSAAYAVGDRVKFVNGTTDVQSIGLTDKTASGQAMTFVITEIVDATNIKVFPKPIALDDAALSTLEKAYANIDTQITSGAVVEKLNVFTGTKKVNAFWQKNALEVTGGDAPLQLLSEFSGMKVISSTMSNGQKMYMAYDGDLATLNFRCRLFTWYGLTMANPSAAGIFVTT